MRMKLSSGLGLIGFLFSVIPRRWQMVQRHALGHTYAVRCFMYSALQYRCSSIGCCIRELTAANSEEA